MIVAVIFPVEDEIFPVLTVIVDFEFSIADALTVTALLLLVTTTVLLLLETSTV